MTEVSSLLYVGLDPDSGFPSSLVGMDPEDTITSSLLPDQVRNVTTYVTNTSATSLNVTSVNGKLGPGVTLNPDDLDDSSTTHKFVTQQLINKVQAVEASATRDQTDAEIETAYNNQVAQISAGEITAGTETSVRRFSPSDVSAMIGAHGGGAGATDHGALTGLSDDDHTQYVLSDGTRSMATLDVTGEAQAYTLGVGTSGATLQGALHVRHDSTSTDTLYLETNDDGSQAAPILSFKRESTSPADGDYIGQIKFRGESDTGTDRVYAKITGKTSDVTNSTEDGLIEIMVRTNGSNNITSRFTGTALKLINGQSLEVAGDIDVTGTINANGDITAANDSTITIPRGYTSTSQDRFAVDGSGIGSGADNLYVTNGAGPFIYYETSTNGSVRNGANEFGLGAVPTYTVSSTPDSYLSGTVPAFYDQDTYCRTIVSSTGVYEIQSMLNLSAASEIDVIYNIKIDNVAIANLADTLVGVATPHFRIVKLQAVKFLTAGQEIRVSLTGLANHLIGSGSNLLIRRIG